MITLSPGQKVTRADVLASFNHGVRNHLTVTWFARPIAFAVTPFFYNSGWTANGVTLFRVALAGVACVCLTMLPVGAYIGGVLFFSCFVLDCVDGNIARLRDSATFFGKFVDGLADLVYAGLMPFAAGIGVWLAFGEPMYLLAGAAITIVTLANQYVRTRLSFTREWMVGTSGKIEEGKEASLKAVRSWQFPIAAIMVNGRFLAALLLFVPGSGPKLYLLVLVAVQLMSELVWLTLTLIEARSLLDRPRRSIHTAEGFAVAKQPNSR